MSHVPRVLLLTGTVPSGREVGGILLRELVAALPPGRLCCAVLHGRLDGETLADPDAPGFPVLSRPLPFVAGADWRAGRPERVCTHLRFRCARHFGERRLLREVVAFGREQRVELVWAALTRPPLYRLAPLVAQGLGVPLVTSVWDPPDSVCLNLRYDRLATRAAWRDFDRALAASLRCGVISENMAAEYTRRYGLPAVVVRLGVPPQLRRPVGTRLHHQDRVTIGFAGAVYALREWQTLLAALDEADWQIAGRKVVLRVLARSVAGELPRGGHVEWLGWRPVDQTVRLLSECDLNYLPYWFDRRRHNAVRLCFPTKLTTYLATGRPVLYHGPAEASPVAFFERFPLAFRCHRLQSSELRATLCEAVSDPQAYAAAAAAINAAIDEELNETQCRARLAELLGLPPEMLQAAPGWSGRGADCSGRSAVRRAAERHPAEPYVAQR